MKFLSVACMLFLAAGASAQNRLLYVNNQTSPNNTITAFSINPNGSLTQLATSPFQTGGNGGGQVPIEGLAIVPIGRADYLYATNGTDGSVSALTLNPQTGVLTPVAGSPFTLNDTSGTYYVTASPDHRFLFVSNITDTDIHVLAISRNTGALSEISGSPFQAGANIAGLEVTPNNRFLLAAANSIDAIDVFNIGSSGALTPVAGSPFPAAGSAIAIQTNCTGNQVFAVNNSTNTIDAYTLAANGTLAPVPGAPFSNGLTTSGSNSFDLALAPNDRFLFTTDSFSSDLSSLSVAPGGSLRPVAGSPVATSNWEGGTAITAAGDLLYSVQFSTGAVDARRIGPNGVLTTVPGTPFANPFNPGNDSLPDSVISFPAPACSAGPR